ncbi:hypothetical protein GJV44_p00009 (plasmid) [Candidatus Vallotia cooleyia]|nr:hypothetical protein GJV44_p00009 [Candidatus Vallotia cooleyia]
MLDASLLINILLITDLYDTQKIIGTNGGVYRGFTKYSFF